jgi:hypothetical protein
MRQSEHQNLCYGVGVRACRKASDCLIIGLEIGRFSDSRETVISLLQWLRSTSELDLSFMAAADSPGSACT